ncbi:hypothetical protein B0H14DRAFT_3869603 [Mycena olivaceomarginata]|nr:hypothetical protein B0H14DRAFT_3869603 [Mycena olivaceomarginata]
MRLSILLPVSSALISVALAAPLLEENVEGPWARSTALDEFIELDVTAEGARISQEISNLDARTLGQGTLGPGTLGPGTLGPGTLGVGTLGVGTLGVGTLGVGTLGLVKMGPVTLGLGTLGPVGLRNHLEIAVQTLAHVQ